MGKLLNGKEKKFWYLELSIVCNLQSVSSLLVYKCLGWLYMFRKGPRKELKNGTSDKYHNN